MTPDKVKEIRAWLSQPQAELFRQLISARIAGAQLEAAQALMDSVEHGNRQLATAQEKAADAVLLKGVLDTMSAYQSPENDGLFSLCFPHVATAKD